MQFKKLILIIIINEIFLVRKVECCRNFNRSRSKTDRLYNTGLGLYSLSLPTPSKTPFPSASQSTRSSSLRLPATCLPGCRFIEILTRNVLLMKTCHFTSVLSCNGSGSAIFSLFQVWLNMADPTNSEPATFKS